MLVDVYVHICRCVDVFLDVGDNINISWCLYRCWYWCWCFLILLAILMIVDVYIGVDDDVFLGVGDNITVSWCLYMYIGVDISIDDDVDVFLMLLAILI